jgi:hypothetical protein
VHAARVEERLAAGAVEVEAHEGASGPRWSVVAHHAELGVILARVTGAARLQLDMSAVVPSRAEVSVALAARPLAELLTILAGTQGLLVELAGERVRLYEETQAPTECASRADAAWAELAARDRTRRNESRLARGTLAEARGDLAEAEKHYGAELEEELSSPLPPTRALALERLHRLARLAALRQEWRAAAELARRLAEVAGPLRSRARLLAAQALLELGDAREAAAALDTIDLAQDPSAAAERRLLMAKAQMRSARPDEALRVLAAGPPAALPAAEVRAHAVRAEALATLGRPVEAGWAWLLFAREAAKPAERGAALRRAAELALENDGALAALFVAREAEALGLGSELDSSAREARARLGLDDDGAALPIGERLALAEALVEKAPGRAERLIATLDRERAQLPPSERAQLAVVRAEVLARREGSGPALALLAAERARLDDAEARALLDRAAARVLEAERRYGAAAEAYAGHYGASAKAAEARKGAPSRADTDTTSRAP